MLKEGRVAANDNENLSRTALLQLTLAIVNIKKLRDRLASKGYIK